jgi:hypothetical protein
LAFLAKSTLPVTMGASLVIQIEELDDSLVNLQFQSAKVILKPTNERARRF